MTHLGGCPILLRPDPETYGIYPQVGQRSSVKLLTHCFPIFFPPDFLAHCSKTTLCCVVCLTRRRPKPVSQGHTLERQKRIALTQAGVSVCRAQVHVRLCSQGGGLSLSPTLQGRNSLLTSRACLCGVLECLGTKVLLTRPNRLGPLAFRAAHSSVPCIPF